MPYKILKNKKKIVVIDDDDEFREELADSLKDAGYDVISLDNCDSIFEIADKVKPDVIMIDLRLKSVSGFEAASALKYFPSTFKIPLIAMSAFYKMEEHDFLARLCGIRRFLKKPFKRSEAVREIEGILKEDNGRRKAGSAAL